MIPIVREFNKCPNCGSESRFLETLAKEVEGKPYTRPNFRFFFDSRTGVVMDQSREAIIPIGETLPNFTIFTDICMDCGTIYAVYLASEPVKKSIAPPKLFRPGDGPPGMNNPMAS